MGSVMAAVLQARKCGVADLSGVFMAGNRPLELLYGMEVRGGPARLEEEEGGVIPGGPAGLRGLHRPVGRLGQI
jgi:hypothetical protein